MNELNLSFHSHINPPDNLIIIPTVYLDKAVRKGFEERDCFNILACDNKSYLYGQNSEGIWYRCDTQYHK